MSLLLREYCGYNVQTSINSPIRFTESENSANCLAPKPDTLMVEVEGIHAYPFRTRNFTRYMPEALKKSQARWTTPYLRPLIKHHNDRDGEIIGRIYDASYSEKTKVDGVGGLIFTVSVPNEQAAKDVENRILDTVSIGVEANDVRCSICGHQILDAKEGCPEGHQRGEIYDNEICCWDVYDIEPKELSYVIVPSDIYAINRKIYRVKDTNKNSRIYKEALGINKKSVELTENHHDNDGGKISDMDFEQQLKDEKAKVEELTQKLENLTAIQEENETLKAQVDDLQKKVDEAVKALTAKETETKKLNDDLLAAQDNIQASKEDLTIANQARENAEQAGMEAQESYHSAIKELFSLYRTILGKPQLDESMIAKRSIESICDSINDFKEEYRVVIAEKGIVDIKEFKVPNPIPPSEEVPPITKHNKEYKPVDLSESFKELFVKALG